MRIFYSILLVNCLNMATSLLPAHDAHEEHDDQYLYAFRICVWKNGEQQPLYHNESASSTYSQHSKSVEAMCAEVDQQMKKSNGALFTLAVDGMRFVADDPVRKWILFGQPGSETGCAQGLAYELSPECLFCIKPRTMFRAITTSLTKKPFIKMKVKTGEIEFALQRIHAITSKTDSPRLPQKKALGGKRFSVQGATSAFQEALLKRSPSQGSISTSAEKISTTKPSSSSSSSAS
jgi:hypothetical protein